MTLNACCSWCEALYDNGDPEAGDGICPSCADRYDDSEAA